MVVAGLGSENSLNLSKRKKQARTAYLLYAPVEHKSYYVFHSLRIAGMKTAILISSLSPHFPDFSRDKDIMNFKSPFFLPLMFRFCEFFRHASTNSIGPAKTYIRFREQFGYNVVPLHCH